MGVTGKGFPKALRLAIVVALVVAVSTAACSPRPRRASARAKARRPAVTAPHLPPVDAGTGYRPWVPWGEHSVATRVAELAPAARQRWFPRFRAAGASYPPWSVVIAAFKHERRVEVYAGPTPYQGKLVHSIPMTAASGGPGPKLREGDRQVPEGVYAIEKLNPNSLYHVSLRLDYPNAFDRAMGEADGRRRLGGDIMIHGSNRSIGCIAVGDQAAEDLFVLAADSGLENVTVVIAPRDFRRTGENEPLPGQPAWVRELYDGIDRRLATLPISSSMAMASPATPASSGGRGAATTRGRSAPAAASTPGARGATR